jgi:hypothetical protein
MFVLEGMPCKCCEVRSVCEGLIFSIVLNRETLAFQNALFFGMAKGPISIRVTLQNAGQFVPCMTHPAECGRLQMFFRRVDYCRRFLLSQSQEIEDSHP